MPELVALDLPGGRAFVDALAAVWDTGDAAAPLDHRLPAPAARALLEALAPTRLVGPDGEITKLADGRGVDDGDALVVATSGSTGETRGVVLTHEALGASARASTERLGIDPLRHTWLCCLPLSHIGGLSVITRALLSDTPVRVEPRFDAEAVERLGRSGEATHVSLVPSALRQVDPAVFTTILLGGGAVPAEVAPNVVTTYGMTETASGVVYDGLPLDGVSVAIGTGRPGEGEPGEILVRGPMLLRAYRDGVDPTVAGPDRTGGWLPTGDGGRLDAGGRLSVDGRLAEVVRTGGELVWPGAVERVLNAVPGVEEVAVWKRRDPHWGEALVAWVRPSDPATPPPATELQQTVRDHLAPWAVPKEIVFVREFPRTASGKVRRAELR